MTGPAIDTLAAVGCADALASWVRDERAVQARRLALVAHWADLHSPDRDVPADASPHQRRTQSVRVSLGGPTLPCVSEFAVDEVGCLLQLTTYAATTLMRDVLTLRHLLPNTWAAVHALEVDVWKARKLARLVHVAGLSPEACAAVDLDALAALTGLPFGRALSVIEAAIITADPVGHETRRAAAVAQRRIGSKPLEDGSPTPTGERVFFARAATADVVRMEAMVNHLADLAPGRVDLTRGEAQAWAFGMLANPALACVHLAQQQPHDSSAEEPSTAQAAAAVGRVILEHGSADVVAKLRPRAMVYVHLGPESVVARPEGFDPLSIPALRALLQDCQVTVKPVLDLAAAPATDAYEIPTRLREAIELAEPFEVFPYGTLRSRKSDLDHTAPWIPEGPPGQTRLDNLGPLSRRHHRAKTFGGFRLTQPEPGVYRWRTPTGHEYEVRDGLTHHLGRPEAAARVDYGWLTLAA